MYAGGLIKAELKIQIVLDVCVCVCGHLYCIVKRNLVLMSQQFSYKVPFVKSSLNTPKPKQTFEDYFQMNFKLSFGCISLYVFFKEYCEGQILFNGNNLSTNQLIKCGCIVIIQFNRRAQTRTPFSVFMFSKKDYYHAKLLL